MNIHLIRAIQDRKAGRNGQKILELNKEWNQLHAEYCFLLTHLDIQDPTAASVLQRLIELRDEVYRQINQYM
jgi:hypothetical protein